MLKFNLQHFTDALSEQNNGAPKGTWWWKKYEMGGKVTSYLRENTKFLKTFFF